MLKGKSVPNNLWVDALSTIIYLLNQRPTKHLTNKTPCEAPISTKPNVSHLRFFSSKAFCHIPKENKRKLDARSIKCIFISYNVQSSNVCLFTLSSLNQIDPSHCAKGFFL